jgi:hypothetical protein
VRRRARAGSGCELQQDTTREPGCKMRGKRRSARAGTAPPPVSTSNSLRSLTQPSDSSIARPMLEARAVEEDRVIELVIELLMGGYTLGYTRTLRLDPNFRARPTPLRAP